MSDIDIRQWWQANAAQEPEYGTEQDKASLAILQSGYDALKRDGWREIIYCPKDGSTFLTIEAGSTGVLPCHYQGEWPKGSWWTHHAGDLWPSRPILWKPMPEEPK